MMRFAAFWLICCGAIVANAQVPIQWSSDLRAGVARAQRTLHPILFYVSGDRDNDDNDLDNLQKRALRDRLVKAIVDARYVALRLPRSNQNKELLRTLGAPVGFGAYLLVVTPEGKRVALIPPFSVADPEKLVELLTSAFHEYRGGLFDKQIRPVLEDEEASATNVRRALSLVREFIIVQADDAIIELLQREDLDKGLRKSAYDTLARISTKKGVKELFEAALTDEDAAAALRKCTPTAAEQMLDELDWREPERMLVAYNAVTRICHITGTKPARFWESADGRKKLDELDRVRDLVRKEAAEWEETYARVR